jgi:hypothetical protein
MFRLSNLVPDFNAFEDKTSLSYIYSGPGLPGVFTAEWFHFLGSAIDMG